MVRVCHWTAEAIGEGNGQMKERMEMEMKATSERAEGQGRLWGDQGQWFNPQKRWKGGLKLINKQWAAGIEGGHSAPENVVSDLSKLIKGIALWALGDAAMKNRSTFVERVKHRFEHWYPQRENERRLMNATIKCLSDADSEQDHQYQNLGPSVTARFVVLRHSQSRLCSATVYDAVDVATKKSSMISSRRAPLAL